MQVRESQQEVERLREELASSAESNRFQDFGILKICSTSPWNLVNLTCCRAMMGIVEEFEKTISQLISEKERESVCNVITRERFVEKLSFILKKSHSLIPGFKRREPRFWKTCRPWSGPSTTFTGSTRGPRRSLLASSPTKMFSKEQWKT